MSFSGPLGNFCGNTGSSGSLPILTLTSDPTVVATAGQLAQLGTYAGGLYVHTTAAGDTNWFLLSPSSAPVVALDNNPHLVATAGPIGQLGTYAAELFLHTTADEDEKWVNLTAAWTLTNNVGALTTLAGFLTELCDLASHRDALDRLLQNAFGGDENAKAVYQVKNGQPSAIVDNDSFVIPFASQNGDQGSPGRALLGFEFKRTEGFTPRDGFGTIDLSDLADSGDDSAPAEIAARIAARLTPDYGNNIWVAGNDRSSAPDWHSKDYTSTGTGEVRGAYGWTLATPNGNFEISVQRPGYSPLVDANGGSQNNLTRLGAADVAAIVARMPLFNAGLLSSQGFDINFADFVAAAVALETPSDTITLTLAPTLPPGVDKSPVTIVAANLHIDHAFAAPTLATCTLEADDNHNGTAGVVKPVDATDPTAGEAVGRLPNGRTLSFLTVTLRTTGDVINNLTNGTAHLEILYRLP